MKKAAIKVLALGPGPELEASLRRGDRVVIFRRDQIGKYDFSKDDIVLCTFPDGGKVLAWVAEQPTRVTYGSIGEKARESLKKTLGDLESHDSIIIIKLKAAKADHP